MRARLNSLRQNSFVRSVSVLVGGTAFGQAITILILPILTRLYTPNDFSVLAVYVGLLGIISVVACLRFDIAIPLPEREEEGINLLALALFFAFSVSLLLAIPCLLAPEWVVGTLKQPALKPYLWLLPLGVLLMSVYSALQFWVTRQKNFRLIARTRITQSLGGAVAQLGFGWAGLAPAGLIVGQMISSGAGALGLGWRTLANSRELLSKVSVTDMRRLFRAYDRFPKYSSLESFANNAAIQVPVLIIAAAALGPEAGYLALAMRVMQAPMGLIGGAIGQVYLSRAPEEHRAGRLGVFTASILGGLMKTGVGPLAFAGIVAPSVFALVFGGPWGRAGVLVAWMTPWFIFQFLASPVSMALHVTNHQKQAFLLQLFGLVMRVGFVFSVLHFYRSGVAEAYAVTGFVFYLIYLILVLKVVGCRLSDISPEIKKAFAFILPWCVGGILFNLIFGIVKNGLH